MPTYIPSSTPTIYPTYDPSHSPSSYPTKQPSAAPTVLASVSGAFNATDDIVSNFGHIMIGTLLVVALLVTLIAYIYHSRIHGADSPSYMAIVVYCARVTDLFTDILFFVELYMLGNELAFFSGIFSFGPHFLSNMIGVLYIVKWRKNRRKPHLITYMRKFEGFFISLSVFGGFFGAVQLCNSNIFHVKRFSMLLSPTEINRLQLLHIFIDVLLESLPSLGLQLMYLDASEGSLSQVMIISMVFSIGSIISGVLSITVRAINAIICTGDEEKEQSLYFKVVCSSNEFTDNHLYCRNLIATTFVRVLQINDYQVETQYILRTGNGIKCKLRIQTDHENMTESELRMMLYAVQDPHSEIHQQLIELLCSGLKFKNENNQLKIHVSAAMNMNRDPTEMSRMMSASVPRKPPFNDTMSNTTTATATATHTVTFADTHHSHVDNNNSHADDFYRNHSTDTILSTITVEGSEIKLTSFKERQISDT